MIKLQLGENWESICEWKCQTLQWYSCLLWWGIRMWKLFGANVTRESKELFVMGSALNDDLEELKDWKLNIVELGGSW